MSMEKAESVSWFGIIRNYVILTATVGIGSYMLRLFVRMSMSCYHQARDAEGRSKLASFYLSLFEKGGYFRKGTRIGNKLSFQTGRYWIVKGGFNPGNVAECYRIG